MADTTTTHYAWVKPEPNASADTWGDKLNANLDSIDAELKAASDVADAAYPIAGGDMTGVLRAMPGSVSAPALSFVGSGTTGFYSLGGNLIGVAGGGVYGGALGANGWTGNTSPLAIPEATATGFLMRPVVALTGNITIEGIHIGRTLVSDGLGAHVVTVMQDSTVNVPLGAIVHLDGGGAQGSGPNASFTVTTGTGVTFHFQGTSSTSQTRTVTVNGWLSIQKIRANQWRVMDGYGVS